jgi:hypothetical protein
VAVFATRYGRPLVGAAMKVGRDRSQLQAGAGLPAVATPPGAIEFPADLVTGPDGVARFAIASHDPGRPRDPIDGQLYGVRAALADTLAPAAAYPHEPGAAISLLVWGAFHADEPPTWWGSIHGLLAPYAKLYPVMRRFLDLGSYDSVCAHRELLLFSFARGPDDPNAMPVTRDMSASARAAVVRWLGELGTDGKPLLGQPPAAGPAIAAETAAPAVGAAAQRRSRDGKAAAAARRLGDEGREA